MTSTGIQQDELPENWRVVSLKEACVQMKQGQILPMPEVKEVGAYPVYGANGRVGFTDTYFLDDPRVLITCRGSTCGVINMAPAKSFVTNNSMILFEKDFIDRDYLFFALQEYSTSNLRTGSGQPQLTQGILNDHKIPVPSRDEQQRIAQVLSTVQEAIAQQERLIRTTTELKQALMQKLFTEGLRGEALKETEIGRVPESWEVMKLERFITLQRGQDLRKDDFRPGKFPVIGATQVIGYHDTPNVKGPGVVVVRSGSSAGLPQYVEEDYWAHNVLLYVKDFHGNYPKFTYYKILDLDLTRFRQGVAVPTLNRNTFSAERIAVPRVDEQRDIADALDAVENKTQAARRKTTILQDLFRTLLHELMTGKVRVGDKALANA